MAERKNTIPEPTNPLVGGDFTDTIGKAIGVIDFINHTAETDFGIEDGAISGLHYISRMVEDALKYELNRVGMRS